MTSPDEPFGPPPTRPPVLGESSSPPIAATPLRDGPLRDGPLRDGKLPTRLLAAMPALGRRRVETIWAGSLTTVVLSGVTGLVLDSRWSYGALGGAFVSLMVVVIGVSLPRPADAPHHSRQDRISPT